MYKLIFFINCGKFYFFKYSFCPFLSSPFKIHIIYMMRCLVAFHRSLIILLQSFSFPFLKLDNLNELSSNLFITSAYRNLLLKASNKILILVIILFNYRIFSWFFSVTSTY